MDIGKLLIQRAREAEAEQKKRKTETVAAKIARFLDGGMSPNEADPLTSEHGQAIDAEIKRRDSQAEQHALQVERHASQLWEDIFDEEDQAVALAELAKFIQSHPTFRRDIPQNVNLLLSELKLNREFVTEENLSKAHKELKSRGMFQTQTAEEQRVQNMSANDFLEEHKEELADNRVPFLILQQAERALGQFISSHPEFVACEANKNSMLQWLQETNLPVSISSLEEAFDACRRAGVLQVNDSIVSDGSTRLVDYGEQRRTPAQPQKYSFREKLKNMSAEEVRQRCLDDRAFERALNSLEK